MQPVYDNHKEAYKTLLTDEHQIHRESWLEQDTLDTWRHNRIRAPIEVFVKNSAKHSWLTVGDGRYGLDGAFLLGLGAKSVHCSDISDSLLEIAFSRNLINEYSEQNAESLKFHDNAFDYVYCKESLHHFPRPYVALHEMFRVARLGVIITEPRDYTVEKSILSATRDIIKSIVGRKPYRENNHEPVGNYVYTFSERELEKFLLGMHFTNISFFDTNDAYIEGGEYIKLGSNARRDKELINQFMREIKRADFLTRHRIRPANLITAALFKNPPSPTLLVALERYGWKTKTLPKNPWIAK